VHLVAECLLSTHLVGQNIKICYNNLANEKIRSLPYFSGRQSEDHWYKLNRSTAAKPLTSHVWIWTEYN